MKIRTDFVTNSSSSSYTISVCIKDTSGKEYIASSDPYGINGESSLDHDLNCRVCDLVNADSLSELMRILIESMQINMEYDWCDDEEQARKMRESDLADATKELLEMKKDLSENTADISQIASIRLTRTWYAWGEAGSGFAGQLKSFVPELAELAEKVCMSEGEAKEAAKQSLLDYLAHYDCEIEGNWCDYFPAGFLGAKVTGTIVWEKCADSIEDFAQKVIDGELADEDYAEETTVIDMQTHTITQKAEYILRRPRKF